MVRRGLAHGEGDGTTAEHIRGRILNGDLILWAAHDGPEVTAAIVLDVMKHPAKTTLFVVLIAGSRFAEWAPQVQALLRDYADIIGADTIEASVRDGLTRWLDRMGWRRKAVIMEMKR